MKVFVVRVNSDTMEGRGAMMLHSVWDNEAIPKKMVDNSRGLMDMTMMEVVSTMDQLNAAFEDEKRNAALYSISAENRRLLGLPDPAPGYRPRRY